MTGSLVLKTGVSAIPDSPEAKQSTIEKLMQVVEQLRSIETLNGQLQGQYAVGSPSWHICESIDDRVHDAFILLGE